MPITKKETKRLRTHTFSEDKVREFGGTYTVAPDFSVSSIIKGSIRLMASKPSIFLLNALGSLIFTVYSVIAFEADSVTSFILYSLAFFFLEMLVVQPFTALSKARLSNLKGSLVMPMLMSLGYLGPLVPIIYVGLVVLALHGFTVFSGIAALVLLAAVVSLHVLNLDASMAVEIAYNEKLDRTTALNRSWFFLSGKSTRVLLANVLVFLPLAAAVAFEAVLGNGIVPILYFTPVIFVLADVCSSWWQSCTTYMYRVIGKKVKPMQYSRL